MSNDKALLCGINNYKNPSVPDLRGCVNDVESVKRLLAETFGFKTANIRVLKDAEVTKAEVKANWSWLVEGAKPGDRLVFHFSGHGSQVPDQGGDEEPEKEGLDEIFCLYDMDFNDPDTYLVDDEIAALRQKVPQGASLTYFFDECHSGSAARVIAREVGGVKQMVALDVNAAQRQMDRSGVRSVDKKKAAEDPADSRSIRVRYLPPPKDFVPPKPRSVKAKSSAKGEIKFVSLSACQDEQTAADAFLDGGFHGAFTHSLCRALREDASQSTKDLVERIHAMLQQGGFVQRPASDGEDRAPIFGHRAAGETPTEDDDSGRGRGEATDDLRSEAADLLEGFVKLLRGRDRPSRRTRATTGRQLVYVHGISTHVEGYSDAWWKSLKPFTSAFGAGTRGETRHEVLWSNLVNSRDVGAQEQELRQRIEDVLEDRQRVEAARAIASPRPAGRDMSSRSLRSVTLAGERGGGLAIDDFLKYMTNSETRRLIIARFVDKVRPLLDAGAEIDVIAHSWGTVVAYEGMREIGGGPSGRVKSFFTAGSALSLPPVRSSLRSENRDGAKPSLVDRWINLDAEGDVIGGALGDRFDVDREELDLVPTGCKRTLFGWGPFSPVCAHGSYFVAENEYVNRVVFAGNIDR